MAGQQFKVAKDQKVFVHRLLGNEGDSVTFDKVLLLDNGTITLGAPAIEGAAVVAKILGHLKGDKVLVFKKKRRKGHRKLNGHRQYFTQIQVESILTSGYTAKVEKQPKAKVETVSDVVPAEKPKKVTKKEAETTEEAPKKVTKKVKKTEE